MSLPSFGTPTPKLLLTSVYPIDPSKKGFDGSKKIDLRIQDGVIVEIGQGLTSKKGEKVVEGSKSHKTYVSPGWMDMHVHLREPGFEHKETIATGTRSAAFGGFTAVACMPNTRPTLHTQDVVETVVHRASHLPVEVHPIGAVTVDRKGEAIAEMAAMVEGGAVAFSDDGDPVYNAEIMRIALTYSAMLGVPIINHEEDLALSKPGHMHEGVVSTRLGLEGSPAIAEEVMIARDIMLAELTGGHVHVAHISTKDGVELVRQGKKKGIRVTTEVCPHHFDLTDEEIERRRFDTHVKMHPPLRSQEDVDAMIEGLKDGTIDAICTDHAPHAPEEKDVEFIDAPNGIIGLDTAWSVAVSRLLKPGHLSLTDLVEKLAVAPRQILSLDIPKVDVDQPANLTVFNTEEEWEYTPQRIHSKSKNSPYVGETFQGRAEAIYHRGQWVDNEL
ncbi:MAG: dihydroorotase [Bacteroidetes bacterium]|nr:dihydroorotase [Bacteroidota bacterium]